MRARVTRSLPPNARPPQSGASGRGMCEQASKQAHDSVRTRGRTQGVDGSNSRLVYPDAPLTRRCNAARAHLLADVEFSEVIMAGSN